MEDQWSSVKRRQTILTSLFTSLVRKTSMRSSGNSTLFPNASCPSLITKSLLPNPSARAKNHARIRRASVSLAKMLTLSPISNLADITDTLVIRTIALPATTDIAIIRTKTTLAEATEDIVTIRTELARPTSWLMGCSIVTEIAIRPQLSPKSTVSLAMTLMETHTDMSITICHTQRCLMSLSFMFPPNLRNLLTLLATISNIIKMLMSSAWSHCLNLESMMSSSQRVQLMALERNRRVESMLMLIMRLCQLVKKSIQTRNRVLRASKVPKLIFKEKFMAHSSMIAHQNSSRRQQSTISLCSLTDHTTRNLLRCSTTTRRRSSTISLITIELCMSLISVSTIQIITRGLTTHLTNMLMSFITALTFSMTSTVCPTTTSLTLMRVQALCMVATRTL